MTPSGTARGTARAVPRRAVKSTPVPLDPALRPEEALRSIARSCVAHFCANLAGIDGPHPREYLHQARIALRRLRSALRLVHPAGSKVNGLRKEIKWLARRLGEARDWDVFMTGIGRLVQARADKEETARLLLVAARRNRTLARKAAREALHSARFQTLRDDLEGWLASPCIPHTEGIALRDFAARALRKRHKRLFRLAAALAHGTQQERHKTRVAAKRLRYIADYFGPLVSPKAARRYVRELADLQDALGTLNDVANARRLAAALPGAPAAEALIEKHSRARERKNLARARAALKRLDEGGRLH